MPLIATADAADATYLRPAFHFLPAKNWQNDPNGPFFDATTGLYHLFFQYNPNAAVWGDMHWVRLNFNFERASFHGTDILREPTDIVRIRNSQGHAVSFDLLGWRELPMALFPDQTYDAAGAYSGSVTLDTDGVPTILYTCVDGATQFQAQCLARPAHAADALFIEWSKTVAANPVFAAEFGRDPTTAWRVPASGESSSASSSSSSSSSARWQAAIGEDARAALLSTDSLTSAGGWRKDGTLYADARLAGIFWECPDLYEMAPGVWAFKASINLEPFRGQDAWLTGRFDPRNGSLPLGAFSPSPALPPLGARLYDHGLFYASKTFFDPSRQRRVLFGWVNEEDAESEHVARGWAGVQSLPRRVQLAADGVNLLTPPIAELVALRGAEERSDNVTLAPSSAWALPLRLCSTQLDAVLRICVPSPVSDFSVGARVLVSASKSHFTEVGLVRASFAIRAGADFVGHTYSIAAGAATVAACRQACEADRARPCVAWSLQPPNATAPLECALKDKLTVPVDVPTGWAGFASGQVLVAAYLKRDRASVTVDAVATPVTAPLYIAIQAAATVDLRIVVDNSIVEVFAADSSVALTARVYPPPGACGVWLSNTDAVTPVSLASVQAWPLASPAPPNIDRWLPAAGTALAWWVWASLGAGALLILVAITVCIVHRRRSNDAELGVAVPFLHRDGEQVNSQS